MHKVDILKIFFKYFIIHILKIKLNSEICTQIVTVTTFYYFKLENI